MKKLLLGHSMLLGVIAVSIAHAGDGLLRDKQTPLKAIDTVSTSSLSQQGSQANSAVEHTRIDQRKVSPPGYGPFESAIANTYAIKGDSTLITVIRRPDGSMALRADYFYNSTTREFEIPPISMDGVPKQEKCILNFASDCTVILLSDGTLRREETLTHPDTRYRFVHEYRLLDSSLVSTTEYIRISGEGNPVLERKKTRTLERISASEIQTVKGNGDAFAKKVAQDIARAEADSARYKANAEEWKRHEEANEHDQRQQAARTWANIGNAVQQDANHMRNMERQLQSSSRQAIGAAERTNTVPAHNANMLGSAPAAKPARQANAEPAPRLTQESTAHPPARTAQSSQIASTTGNVAQPSPQQSTASNSTKSGSSSSAYLTVDDSYAKENRKHAEMMEARRKKEEREEAERERIKAVRQAEIDAEQARRAADAKKAKEDLKAQMEKRKKNCEATLKDCGSMASRQ